MAYIDHNYYTNTFNGTSIPENEFARLAAIASDVIDSIVQKPVELTSGSAPEDVKRATAYEVECLYEQGGIDAITGFSAGATAQSESLSKYSVNQGGSSAGSQSSAVLLLNGIPVSRLSVHLLRKAGLMCRWAYAGCRRDA